MERIKTLVADAEANTLPEQLEAEKHSFVEALHHPDAREGIDAFLAKRKPTYR